MSELGKAGLFYKPVSCLTLILAQICIVFLHMLVTD